MEKAKHTMSGGSDCGPSVSGFLTVELYRSAPFIIPNFMPPAGKNSTGPCEVSIRWSGSMLSALEKMEVQPPNEFEVNCRLDVDGNRWLWKSRTTCFDLLDAVSFYLCTGWPTSKLPAFLDHIQPSSGWIEDGHHWSKITGADQYNLNATLASFQIQHINVKS